MSEVVLDRRLAAALARELTRAFTGNVLTAGEPGFNEARTIWNAMVFNRPALVARCATSPDVAASANLARRHELQR
jgi:hypothetical protein